MPHQTTWIEKTFKRRMCFQFVPSPMEKSRCCCGDALRDHQRIVLTTDMLNGSVKWHPLKNTKPIPTDAFGTIEFQGGPHPIKAQYVRLSHDTRPEEISRLFSNEWHLQYPTLLMSIHGGKANFNMQPKLKKVIQKGLLKAAKTTGAWIFTGGVDCGVVKHVGEAFVNERSQTLRGHVVTIGIAPWGIIENREKLIGKDVTVPYHSISSPKSEFAALNNRHAYFLLVDNGTVGKHGSEIVLRKKLEKHISKQKILTSQQSKSSMQSIYASGTSLHKNLHNYDSKSYGIPVVGVVIEGGANTIRYVLDYVTDTPPVPVVVCDGSGRAADLLAFVHKYAEDDGSISSELHNYLISTIMKTFEGISNEEALRLCQELLECVKKKELITVFRMGESSCLELDHAILTALLKGSGLSPPDQLALAMAWNRVDVASSEIFVYGRDWTNEQLEHAMMDALQNDLVDFVKLLLENGLNMQRFLTISRSEELYNTKMGPCNTLKYLVRDIQKHTSTSHRYTLQDIGMVIEKLMGGAYCSKYRHRDFRLLYESVKKKEELKTTRVLHVPKRDLNLEECHFQCPYNDLFIWSVLMKRQRMALFMWQRGEEPIAKALVAIRLYKRMAHEAAQDDVEADVSDELRKYSWEFEELATQLLDYSYRQDTTKSQRMLTYELQNWSKQTCLTLAVTANHREFLAHPCCQILLADLWMGGLRMRKSTYLKVIMALLFPPFIILLEFKSKQELQLMPQTEEEHILEQQEDRTEDNSSEYDDGSLHDIENGSVRASPRNADSQESVIYNVKYSGNQSGHHAKRVKKKPIKIGRKIYEFYTAPVTKFFGHTITYFLFLLIFTYSVLVRMTPMASAYELFCLFYVATLACEQIREIAILEPMRIKQKVAVWVDNKWHMCDVTFILLFMAAFVTRMWPEHLESAKIVYGVDIIYWYIRILHFVSVNKALGPYVTMMGKMIIDMLYFVVLLLIVLMAFGVARQGILNPYEDPSWDLAKEIFFKPYFMLYGEVFADTIDPPCGEGPDLTPCRKGRWVTIVAMSIFLLVANILLINLLIAVFNNTFLSVTAISQQVWKSKRYTVVMEYEQKPLLPPPLIIVNHLYLAMNFIKHRYMQKAPSYCHVLKLFLSDKDLEAINDFEEECIEGYFRENESKLKCCTDAIVKLNHERVEQVAQKLEDMHQSEKYISAMQQELDCRISDLYSAMDYVGNSLAVIHRFMAIHRTSISEDYDVVDSEHGMQSDATGDRQCDHNHDMDNDDYDVDDDDSSSRNGNGDVTCAADDDAVEDDKFPMVIRNDECDHQKTLPASGESGVTHGGGGGPGIWTSKASTYDSNRLGNCRRRKLSSVRYTTDTASGIAPAASSSLKSEFEAPPTHSLLRKGSSQSRIGLRSSLNRRSMRNKHSDAGGVQWPAPLHEYTSITDEIESIGIYRPPYTSPSHSVTNTFVGRRPSDVSKLLSDTEQAILEKEKKLLNAERVDYQHMESLIERRLYRNCSSNEPAHHANSVEMVSIGATISTDQNETVADSSDVATVTDMCNVSSEIETLPRSPQLSSVAMSVSTSADKQQQNDSAECRV